MKSKAYMSCAQSVAVPALGGSQTRTQATEASRAKESLASCREAGGRRGRSSLSRSLLAIAGGLACASAAAAPHEYFDQLSGRSDVLVSAPLRSNAQIEPYIAAQNNPENRVNPPSYDSAQDGARWQLGGSSESVNIADALRIPFGEDIQSGNLLMYFEARWDGRFPQYRGTLETHKAFRADTRDFRSPVLEMRARYTQDCNGPNDVAKVDGRVYYDSNGWLPNDDNVDGRQVGDNLRAFNDFCIQGDTWTSFWIYVDYGSRTWYYYAADDTRGPVAVVDRYQQSSMGGDLDGFRFQYNSSQTGRNEPVTLSLWARNFVALRNVPNFASIIAEWNGSGGSGGAVNPPPAAPTNLRRQ